MAEIVRRRSWGGVLPLGRHVSISGSRAIHAPSVSIAPSSFQEEQNARHHKQVKLEQALEKNDYNEAMFPGREIAIYDEAMANELLMEFARMVAKAVDEL